MLECRTNEGIGQCASKSECQPIDPSSIPVVRWSTQAPVLSTTRFPEAVVPDEHSAYGRILNSSADFAEFFAELRAMETPNSPLCSCLLR